MNKPLVPAKPHHETVISLRNQGLKYREIADQLGITMRTVACYITAAYAPQPTKARPTLWATWASEARHDR